MIGSRASIGTVAEIATPARVTRAATVEVRSAPRIRLEDGRPASRRRGVRAFVLCLAIVLPACGGAEEDPVLSRAGIDASTAHIIATSGWPQLRDALAVDVLFTGVDIPEEAPLFRVRAILTDPAGQVYIANAGSHEILAVDSEGVLQWRKGRQGEGPQEFSAMSRLQWWRADTLAVIDPVRGTASLWTRSGEFVRVRTARPVIAEPSPELAFSMPAQVIGIIDDDRLVVLGPTRARRTRSAGLSQARSDVMFLGVDDAEPAKVLELPGMWVYELSRPGRLPAILAPMTPGTALAVHVEGLAWARADRFEVVVLDPDGRAGRVLRISEPLEQVTAEIHRAYLEDWSPWFPVQEPIPFPSTVPAFDRVFFSLDGDVWARRYHWGDRREEWARFAGPSGAVALFRFPPRTQIMAASADAAFGVWRDDLDVEHVVRVRLDGR